MTAPAGPDVRVRLATTLDDARAVAAVFGEVWGQAGAGDASMPVDLPMRVNTLRALAHSGGYVALAETAPGGRCVGASAAWLGRSGDGVPLLHSHMTGVVEERQGGGVGLDLKRHQREWCLERAIEVIEWTFDPLVRRNAWFNLARLGAVIDAYEIDFYGPMEDGVNRGDESDRALATWHLESAAARAALSGPTPLTRKASDRLLLATHDDRPTVRAAPPTPETGDRRMLCEIPSDIVALRSVDAGAARAWRLALRATLGAAVASGWRAAGITVDGAYVLVAQPAGVLWSLGNAKRAQ